MVQDLCNAAAAAQRDSLAAAVYDWTALGLSAGFRGIEWAQESSKKINCAEVQLEKGKPPSLVPMSFVLGDFMFLDAYKCPLFRKDRAKAAFVMI